MKKSIIIVLLTAVCSASLVGCGNSGLKEVMNYTGMSESAIKGIYADAKDAYEEGDYVTAIQQYGIISGYKNSEKMKNSAQDKYVADVLANVQKFENSEQYPEALDYIYAAESVTGSVVAFENKKEEILNQYRQSVFQVADSYVSENKYESAYAVLEGIKAEIGNDAQVEAKIIEIQGLENEYNKGLVWKAIEEFDVSEQKGTSAYAELIKRIDGSMDIMRNDAEISGKLAEYQSAYRNLIMEEAANAFNSSGWAEALRIVQGGLEILVEDEQLIEKEAEYASYEPVSISELVVMGYNAWRSGTFEDTHDIEYTEAYKLGGNNPSKKNNYVEFFVEGKYSKIKGVYASNMSHDEYGKLRLYADDKLIYTSPEIYKKTKATEFEVDISGAQYVKLWLDGGSLWASVILSDLYVCR